MIENTQRYRHIRDFLVETDWLEHHLNDDDLRVYDCSVSVQHNPNVEQNLQQPFVYNSARLEYELEHIPRAGFIDIPDELSDLTSELPLTLLPEKKFIEVMSRIGIDENTKVVLYSTTETNWAARVWWMLHTYGFDNAVLLNGGWKKWTNESRPRSKLICEYPPGKFRAHYRNDAFVNKDQVLSAIENKDALIINALPSLIHTGESEITFGRKGRISGSVNVSFTSLQDPISGCYLSIEKLHKHFHEVGVDKFQRIINYCGAGIASSNNAFTLSLLGYSNVAVYDGSLLEWGNDRSLPMEVDNKKFVVNA